MYLLDTCVLSETRNRTPNREVIRWLSEQDPNTLFISAISIGEIKNGICALGATRKARDLAGWLSDIERDFASRILSVNVTVAECWGEIMSRASADGYPRPPVDALIAATAKVDDLTLVTRNVSDMEHTGVRLLNPFGRHPPTVHAPPLRTEA